jgi:capsular exopolysaccharide synthesis family protein
MSRIHDILDKAEREGTARRLRTAGGTPPAAGELPGEIPDVHAHPRVSAAAAAVREVAPPPMAHPPASHAPALEPVRGVVQPQEIRGAELDPVLVSALAPQSLAAEQYRALRTRIIQSDNGRVIRTIAITSPSKGDGKSVNATNLALTMAQEFQRRIVLVDADLRHPRAHQLLGLTEGVGLADVLAGDVELETAMVSLPEHNLTVLPAGIPPTHPAELLGSSAMRRVIETLRQRFDRIVIDMPPAAPLADAQILAPLVDGVVVIVRAGVTPRPAIDRTLAAFDRSRVLGLVLNEAGVAPDGYYGAEYTGA